MGRRVLGMIMVAIASLAVCGLLGVAVWVTRDMWGVFAVVFGFAAVVVGLFFGGCWLLDIDV